MILTWQIAFSVLAAVSLGLLVGLFYQVRLIRHSRADAERVQAEKEAVISLMDNIGERMTRGIDLDETLNVIIQYIVKTADAESGAIYLFDEPSQTLQARVIVGLFPALFEDEEILQSRTKYLAEKIRNRKIKLGEGILGSIFGQEKPLLINDAEAHPRIPRAASAVVPVQSLMLFPMRVRGRNLGGLVVANKKSGGVFDERDGRLLQALAEQAAVTVDLVKLYDVVARQQRLEQELKVAREFQGMLLPQELPVVNGYEFSAINRSALTVGGDFYDFFFVDRGHLGIVIADVSGKGIPAALIMATVRANLRAEARDTLSPKEALRRVNDRILHETKESVFVTITYAILDIRNQRMKLVRAGHEPVLIRHEAEGSPLESVKPDGMAVGLMEADIFDQTVEREVQLEPGDLVLFYTDGVIEAENGASEEFGRGRLEGLLSAGKASRSAAQLLAEISAEIDKFAAGAPQHDDITLLALRVKPQEDRAGSAQQGNADDSRAA